MEPQPPHADLLAVDEPEVDAAALQAEVRAAAARARQHGTAVVLATGTRAEVAEGSPAGPRLSPLHATAEVRPFGPLSGSPLGAVQRAIRRGLRWYLWPATAQASAHNRAVADVVAEHRRQLTRLRLDAERLDADTAPR